MSGRYAQDTTVSVESSQQEIGRIFSRYKIDTYVFGATPGQALVQFEAHGFPIKIAIPLPARPGNPRVMNPATGRMVDANARWQQEIRSAWRALVLLIKANLEAVDHRITTVDRAFMAYLLAPDGRVLSEHVLPDYRDALTSGRLALEGGRP